VGVLSAGCGPMWWALLTLAALNGSPPHLLGLEKAGKGRDARWKVASYTSRSLGDVEVALQTDRNPTQSCVKMQFLSSGDCSRHKVCYMLLERSRRESVLRGMHISEEFRGLGLSKVFLAIWLRLCLESGVTPRTAVINKPLLSLALHRLGFMPIEGVSVEASDAKRYRDCILAPRGTPPGATSFASGATVVRVHCEFVAPANDDSSFTRALDAALGDSHLHMAATSRAILRALTLRGGCIERLASLRCPPQIPAAALTALFGEQGFCVVPDWLNRDAVALLRTDATLCDAAGLPREAGVGSTRHGDSAVRRDYEIRRSKMLPLYPPPRQSAGLVDTRIALGHGIRELGRQMQQAATAVAPHVLPPLSLFHTELAYLFYPPGGMYKRHLDVPAARGGWCPMGRGVQDGGSFSEAALRREISLLLYLEESWDPSWGGQLRVYTAGHSGDIDSYVDVQPEGGTLVLLRSDRVAHEVLETTQSRRCLVGWFRTYRDHCTPLAGPPSSDGGS
jgi:SM-20-related protein